MNRRILAIIGLVILGGLLFWGGSLYGQSRSWVNWTPGSMMGRDTSYSGMMGNTGMMGNMGMMGMMSQGNAGMMNGNMMGMMMNGDMMGNGMMGNAQLQNVEPLSLEEAAAAVNNYLATLNDDNLAIGEIMIFDNHAYAEIRDTSTSTGAFEVLIDPTTGNVFPEPGPNMMWNNTYGQMTGSGNMMGNGMMNGNGMMGNGSMMGNGMMNGSDLAPEAEISTSAEEALTIAQRYLDTNLAGATAGDEAEPFPGYYTIHVERDGQVVGMLSVNAYTGQVFLHHWHGEFIEMSVAEHE